MSHIIKNLIKKYGSTKENIEEIKTDPEGHFEKIRQNIEKKEKEINAFISLFIEDLEQKLKEKNKDYNLIISVKDNIWVKNKKTTAASKMLENYIAPEDATVIKNLKLHNFLIIGKTNMDEFACGSDGSTSYFGPTKNPLDLERVPGGSSSGAAAALAAGMCDLSLGSDTGGSIRCPSAFCSVFGLKPTYGLVSRYGLLDMAMSLEQIGPLAKDTYGIALLLDIITGKDDKDPVSIEKPIKSYINVIENFNEKILKNRKVIYAKEFIEHSDKRVVKAFNKTLNILSSYGLEIREISIPEVEYLVPIYYLIVFSEFASAMQKYQGLTFGYRASRKDLWETIMESRKIFGKEVKRRILLGVFTTSQEAYGKWYKKAISARLKIRDKILSLLKENDYLVSPTMPVEPWKFGEIKDPLKMYLSDILTVLANICGIPAINIPVEEKIGFQIMSNYLKEPKILELSQAIENYFIKN